MGLEDIVGKEILKEMKGKEFGINPNSRYSEKEFLTRAEELFTLDKSYRELSENSGNLNALKLIGGIALKYMPGNPSENAQIIRDPYVASEQAEVLLNAGKKKLAGFVGNNLPEIMKKLSPENVKSLIKLYTLPKEVRAIREILDEGDMTDIKRMYFEDIGYERVLIDGAAHLQDSQIREIMNRKYNIRATNFIEKNFTTKKGKKKSIFNVEKAREYVSETISKLDDKRRSEAYLSLGYHYYDQKARGKKSR